MTDDLPEGWTTSTLGELTDVVGGGTPPTKDPTNFCGNGGHPWLTPADLSGFQDIYVSRGGRNLTPEGLRASSAKLVPKGTVLMSSRAPIGYLAIAANEICTNQGFKSFVCSQALEPLYVFFWLRSINSQLQEMGSGSTFAEISGGRAKEISIPIAPIAEQRRIVAKIESVLREGNTARVRLASVPITLRRFRQSVLAAACSGRLTAAWREQHPETKGVTRVGEGEPPSGANLPKTWNWMLSSHAFGFVTSGSRGWARYYSKNGAVFVRVGNLNHDSIVLDLASIQRVAVPASAEGRRTRVMKGDLLISITADVGMVALVEPGLEEAYINQHVALARPVGGIDRRYLAYFLAAKNGGQKQFRDLQRGATKVGLGLGDIRSIWIALPPPIEQQEIVRRIEALFKLADDIQGRLATAREQIDQLTTSLFAKAFRGELVETEAELARRERRKYESASELLQRMKLKREGVPATASSSLKVSARTIRDKIKRPTLLETQSR